MIADKSMLFLHIGFERYDEEKAVIDTSIRYLYYYQVEIVKANSSIRTEERNEMKLTFKRATFLIMQFMFLVCFRPKPAWHNQEMSLMYEWQSRIDAII